ncbi:MAG: ABC transporter permease [Verrucomicrobia bacterium]|nr:ABC transporter permease [Verrucomicrobiota bacterium]
MNDLKLALRLLCKHPGYTLTVVFILALGIGANTAVFSVVNAVLLSPLPYKNPRQIVQVWRQQIKGAVRTNMGHKDFKLLREPAQAFEQVAAYCRRRVYVQGIDRPLHVRAQEISPNMFALLGAQPALGRGFLPEEEQEGNDRVVVLSDTFWKDHFGGAAEAIGKPLLLDGQSHTVVGVMPPEFQFPYGDRTPFWLPLVLEPTSRPFNRACLAFARLKPGVSEAQARAHVAGIGQRLIELYPFNAGTTLTVERLPDGLFGNYRRMLWLLLGATGFVLLIACSNVANLQLVRAAARQRELAVRLAVGASRGHLVRQMLTESVVVSMAAGLLGLLVSYWALKALLGLCPAGMPRMEQTRVDTTVLLFTLTISVLTGLVFGLIPAWKGSDIHLGQALKEGLAQASAARGWRRLRDSFVVSQLGVSLVLLVGGALLLRSLLALQAVDLGFRPEHLLRVRLELPEMKYPKYPQRSAFFEQLCERVRGLPGVQAAAYGEWSGHGGVTPFSIGNAPVKAEAGPVALGIDVSPGFFETLQMRLLKGRTFTRADLPTDPEAWPSERPVVIDDKLARDYFADQEPLGQRLRFDEHRIGTIVGVVSATRLFEDLAPAYGRIYLPLQHYYYINDLVIRVEGDPLRLVKTVGAQVTALDPDQAISKIDTAEADLAGMLAPRRFSTVLIGLAGGLALLLAVVGIYGLLQYSITLQFHEIGIRMALGATRTDVLKATLRQGFKLALIGIAVGLAGALALSRVLTSLLYEVRPTDAFSLASASILLGTVALAACWVPARRAAKVDPMVALRYE